MFSALVQCGCVLMGVQWLAGCGAPSGDGAPDLGFTPLGAFGTWTGATSMTYMNGKLYVIQDNVLWSVDSSTGGYTPIELPHFDYSGPTVMAAFVPRASSKP